MDRIVKFWFKEIFVVYSLGKDGKCNVFVFLVIEVCSFSCSICGINLF